MFYVIIILNNNGSLHIQKKVYHIYYNSQYSFNYPIHLHHG